jgi:hypothetical protein
LAIVFKIPGRDRLVIRAFWNFQALHGSIVCRFAMFIRYTV